MESIPLQSYFTVANLRLGTRWAILSRALHLHYVFLCSLFSPFQMKTFLFPFRDFLPSYFSLGNKTLRQAIDPFKVFFNFDMNCSGGGGIHRDH